MLQPSLHGSEGMVSVFRRAGGTSRHGGTDGIRGGSEGPAIPRGRDDRRTGPRRSPPAGSRRGRRASDAGSCLRHGWFTAPSPNDKLRYIDAPYYPHRPGRGKAFGGEAPGGGAASRGEADGREYIYIYKITYVLAGSPGTSRRLPAPPSRAVGNGAPRRDMTFYPEDCSSPTDRTVRAKSEVSPPSGGPRGSGPNSPVPP
jgi:hypothetical protein